MPLLKEYQYSVLTRELQSFQSIRKILSVSFNDSENSLKCSHIASKSYAWGRQWLNQYLEVHCCPYDWEFTGTLESAFSRKYLNNLQVKESQLTKNFSAFLVCCCYERKLDIFEFDNNFVTITHIYPKISGFLYEASVHVKCSIWHDSRDLLEWGGRVKKRQTHRHKTYLEFWAHLQRNCNTLETECLLLYMDQRDKVVAYS